MVGFFFPLNLWLDIPLNDTVKACGLYYYPEVNLLSRQNSCVAMSVSDLFMPADKH